MAVTAELFTAFHDRLTQAFRDLAVDYFPDDPETYRVNHPWGALLVNYTGTRYSEPFDTGLVAQEGQVKLTITVILRQLNGGAGAVAILGRLRKALVGWRAPGASTKTRAVEERFLGETAGLWQYAFDVECGAVLVEDVDTDDGVFLRHATVEDGISRHDIVKQDDGTITHEETPL